MMRRLITGLICALFLYCRLTPAVACLGCYRTPEEVAAGSPLIFIGKVESVQPDPVEGSSWGRYGDDAMVADFKILRILKGSYDEGTVKVHSGPVESCAPDAVHYKFITGNTYIVLLSVYPKDGVSGLYTNMRLLSPSYLEMIEACLHRAILHRANYLDRVRRTSPEEYKAAEKLFAELSDASKTWPSLNLAVHHFRAVRLPKLVPDTDAANADGEQASSSDEKASDAQRQAKQKEYDAARNSLVEMFHATDPLVLRTVVALDWLNDDPDSFSKHELWREAAREVEDDKRIVESERAELRLILQKAGVSKKYIDAYMNFIPDEALITGFDFPIRAPDPYNYEQKKGDILTTDFILRYNCFNRGGMYPAYAMRFDQLESLDPDRLAEVIPAVYGSKDSLLSLVAYRAIQRVEGTQFVGLLYDQALRGDGQALQALVVKDNEEETARRIEALLTEHDSYLWYLFTKQSFFDKVAIDKAISLLEEYEKQHSENAYEEQQIESRRQELRKYLKAAMAGSPDGGDNLSAAQFREWFQKHPRQKTQY